MKIAALPQKKIVLIVHAVDTEGPLFESLEAKFQRLKDLYKLEMEPSHETLEKLRRGEIPLGGIEREVQKTLSGHLAGYLDTWERIDEQLSRLNDPAFRLRMPDSFGKGWIFNWHCLDHVGYESNPRRRDLGYHKVFDHYRAALARHGNITDGMHWHFHPMSIYREAHRCATSYMNSPELYQILCRRLIERDWFPTVFRAGFQSERPDSNLFLEQWIPFDITNMALDDNSELDSTVDFRNGRSGDWRLAPSDWSLYHPHHDNYQLPGNCRRFIARALNVLNRLASINQAEMDKAFSRAEDTDTPVLVGLASHDFRNLETEVESVRELISVSRRRHPGVAFKYCEAVDAFRCAIWPDGVEEDSLDLELEFSPETAMDVPHLEITARKGRVFGPQPFLAIRTRSGRFLHDNLDFDTKPGRWHYAFHGDTLPLGDVSAVAVGANDRFGNVSTKKIMFE